MIDAGIRHGDWVVLDKSKQPKDGDIIAANVDWQWTLKYFRQKNGVVYLAAANPAYDPIFPKNNLEVGGVVIRAIREYY
jgi:repressor LexA